MVYVREKKKGGSNAFKGFSSQILDNIQADISTLLLYFFQHLLKILWYGSLGETLCDCVNPSTDAPERISALPKEERNHFQGQLQSLHQK